MQEAFPNKNIIAFLSLFLLIMTARIHGDYAVKVRLPALPHLNTSTTYLIEGSWITRFK